MSLTVSQLSGLVHDMRTPLHAVSAALELLGDDRTLRANAESRELISAALHNIAHLNELIHLILDTGRLAEGQFTPYQQALQPHVWLAETLSMLRPLLLEKRLTLEIHCHSAVQVLWGDRLLLTRTIQNLVGNAIKFTPAGGRIGVSIEPDATADAVVLRVSDTGDGIAADVMPYLYQRYVHGRGARRDGYGLGLYFCKLVAEAHAGSIAAESTIGAGTTVTIRLPMGPALAEGQNGALL